MPIMQSTIETTEDECAGPPQFKISHWGQDVDLIFIDVRSCRSASVEDVCQNDLAPTLPPSIRRLFGGFLSENPPPGCLGAINDPSRTMLGSTQKALFKEALLESTAKFKFVITPVAMQQLYVLPYDSWEGYGAERSEILNFIRDNDIKDVIFLTTDLHQNRMNEVFIDRFRDPTPIAYEFMTGPIAALTYQNTILGQFGPSGLVAYNTILNILGLDCRHLNVYSYGSVNIDAASSIATVSLKDENGNIIHDQVNPSITCFKQFEAQGVGGEIQQQEQQNVQPIEGLATNQGNPEFFSTFEERNGFPEDMIKERSDRFRDEMTLFRK